MKESCLIVGHPQIPDGTLAKRLEGKTAQVVQGVLVATQEVPVEILDETGQPQVLYISREMIVGTGASK